ncbi:MAG TPA: GDSL-type esterase/lipase family protein [Opitutaceae bacterium]|nr:GDSL-type esterase/lipase family protein [Opitutaceae bacterium]
MKYPSLLLGAALAVLPFVAAVNAADEPLTAVANEDAHYQLPATDDGLPGTGPIRRYDWFKKLWYEKRSAWAKNVQKDQGALVFLGDSITQGWWDVGNVFAGVKIANRGISGDTTRGVLIRLKEDVLDLKPKGIVLLIGTNDLEEKAKPETIAGNLKLLLEGFKKHDPAMPVVLCSVFPSSDTKNRPHGAIQKINELYRDVAEEFPQVTLLDTWSLFANAQGDAKPEEMPDLLHPNFFGYGKWANALRPILETLNLVPTWPDDFKPEAGFTSLFNGRDLTGWGYEDGPTFDKKISSSDGRYLAKDGRLIVTVSKKQRDYRALWTTRKYPKDFVLKFEFRASPGADSGVYIRKPQLQIRDYPVIGPFAALKNYRSSDWNEVAVTVSDGLAHATCNGEVLVDAFPVPETGPIGIESDRGQVEYRRIRLGEKTLW